MANTSRPDRWVLEVVRGRDIGKRYVAGAGEILLGNALAGAPGFDLADQEANSPRRMAAKQAALAARGDVLEIRDLESPGGTFVNRQRLLSGQARALQPGDLIQLGGVQLRVYREAAAATEAPTAKPAGTAAPSPAKPGALALACTIAGAGTCRNWDDFLTLSAQRWSLVRDELTSGRIAEHMKRIQRLDLVPRPEPGQSADDQLDSWLARLPVSRSSAPELDVHPATLSVRASAGGGLVRQSLRITNVGYRLLKSSVRFEQPAAGRIRSAAASGLGPFVTIDQTDLPIEIEVPDDASRFASGTLLGTVIVQSNGGTKRIDVRLERSSRPQTVPDASQNSSPIDPSAWTRPLGDRVAALPLAGRLVLAALALMAFRLLIALSALIPTGTTAAAGAGAGALRLDAIALLFAATGLLAGAVWASRSGEEPGGATGRDMAAAGFAGGLIGLFAAAIGFALIRSIESVLGARSNSPLAATAFWGVLGVVLAVLSWFVLPPQARASKPTTEPTS